MSAPGGSAPGGVSALGGSDLGGLLQGGVCGGVCSRGCLLPGGCLLLLLGGVYPSMH